MTRHATTANPERMGGGNAYSRSESDRFCYKDLVGNDFDWCDLSGSRFEKCSMQLASLSRAEVKGAVFDDCCFDDAFFLDSDFEGAAFRDCSFQGSRIEGANFVELRFNGDYDEPLKGRESRRFKHSHKAYNLVGYSSLALADQVAEILRREIPAKDKRSAILEAVDKTYVVL